MNKLICFSCLFLISLSSCSTLNGDETSIKSLITSWSQVSPDAIGGPSELKDVTQIKEIKVENIRDSKFARFGCENCKEAQATMVCVSSDNTTKNILYQLQNLDGEWAITEWEVVGGQKGNCYPPINMEVIEARKTINQ